MKVDQGSRIITITMWFFILSKNTMSHLNLHQFMVAGTWVNILTLAKPEE